jgi:hypothetical protein
MKQNVEINNDLTKEIQSCRDLVLGNLLMIGQIPAETFSEQNRVDFVLQRFNEFENVNAYKDDGSNAVGILKGKTSQRKIAVTASLDTRFGDNVEHDIRVSVDSATGPGVANNSLGAAALISLPEVLQRLGMELDADILFVGTTRSLGRGDVGGMREFFQKYPFDIDFCVNLTGTTLGRVDHFCQSTVRGEITCTLDSPEEFSHSGFGEHNAILILNELINSLLDIPIAGRPKTSLNIGIIRGGESYSSPCPKASMKLYVRSEEDCQTEKLMERIQECCEDIGSKNQAQMDVHFFGRQRAAGLRYGHPLVQTATQITKQLGYKPVVAPSNTQIAVPLSMGIPSLTVGISTGRRSTLPDGRVDLEPIPQGLLQVITLLNSIDKGECDECSE